MFAWEAGTRSASSVSFHFIKNMSWPLLSVAPEMHKEISHLATATGRASKSSTYQGFSPVPSLGRILASCLRVLSFWLIVVYPLVLDSQSFVFCLHHRSLLDGVRRDKTRQFIYKTNLQMENQTTIFGQFVCRSLWMLFCGFPFGHLPSSFFLRFSSKADINSAQSKFSSGSHELSCGP